MNNLAYGCKEGRKAKICEKQQYKTENKPPRVPGLLINIALPESTVNGGG